MLDERVGFMADAILFSLRHFARNIQNKTLIPAKLHQSDQKESPQGWQVLKRLGCESLNRDKVNYKVKLLERKEGPNHPMFQWLDHRRLQFQ